MNSLTPFRLAACLAAVLPSSLALAAEDADDLPPSETPQLQLIVDMDRRKTPMEAIHASETMAIYARDALKLKGYKGEIQHVPRDKAVGDATTLVIQVTNWRIDMSGHPDCTLLAAVFINGGRTELGEFSSTDYSGGQEALLMLRTVAERSLRKMADAIRDRKLLPGFVDKKKKR